MCRVVATCVHVCVFHTLTIKSMSCNVCGNLGSRNPPCLAPVLDSALSQAASVLFFVKAPFGRGMADSKHKLTDVEDASDRAQKRRKSDCLARVHLDKITFWPFNRGSSGIISHHIHEVAFDCVTNKVSRRRYNHVDIVEIPDGKLKEIKDACRERSQQDSLMPKFSENIKYVCLTKTHFTHAQKLALDGNRCLFNENPPINIRWTPEDVEGATILAEGPVCQIYSSSLFDDQEAMEAMGSEDNLNANVQMGEDEMQAFGRVSEHMSKMPISQDAALSQAELTKQRNLIVSSVINKMEVTGLGTFNKDHWKAFILLRLQLPETMAKIFQTCQFNACAGRVRVRPEDFGVVATIDPRAPWSKVALMLWQYLGNMTKRPVGETFGGRQWKMANKLQVDIVKELVAESAFVLTIDEFIRRILMTYSKPTGNGTKGSPTLELLSLRGDLIANQGRFMIAVGRALETATKKAAAFRRTLTPEERIAIIQKEGVDAFAKAEDLFRKQLVDSVLYKTTDMPAVLYPFKTDAVKKTDAAPSQATLPSVKIEPGSDKIFSEPPSTELGEVPKVTEAHTYNRLRINGPGEEKIWAFIPPCVPNGLIKAEKIDDDDSTGLVTAALPLDGAEDIGSSPFVGAGKWCTVRLRQLCLPNAVVELGSEDGGRVMSVAVDDLRALDKLDLKPVIPHPSMASGGKTLLGYDYQFTRSVVAQNFAERVLFSLHLSAHQIVGQLSVHILSEEGKLPVSLQVRAKKAFKKGELTLVPAYGEVIDEDS